MAFRVRKNLISPSIESLAPLCQDRGDFPELSRCPDAIRPPRSPRSPRSVPPRLCARLSATATPAPTRAPTSPPPPRCRPPPPPARAALRAGYPSCDLRADLLAGIVVGRVALPLSMALAVAWGVPP